jgi:hypothetical protein
MRWFDIGSLSDKSDSPCGATQFALRKELTHENPRVGSHQKEKNEQQASRIIAR